MAEQKISRLLRIAVYIILLLIAIVMILIRLKMFPEASTFSDLLINLSTDLLSVVLIFFIVEHLFKLNENQLAEKMEINFQQINSNLNQSLRDDKFYKKLINWENSAVDQGKIINVNFFQNLKNSSNQLLCLGYNLEDFLRDFRAELISSIKKGLKVKMLLVDPNSTAGELLKENSKKPDWIFSSFNKSMKYINEVKSQLGQNSFKDKFEIKLISWIPGCSLIILEDLKNNGIARIALHPLSLNQTPGETHKRISLILQQSDLPHDFEYFRKSFLTLWTEGREI